MADSLSRVPNPGVCTWPDAVHVGKASCPQPQPPVPHHLQPYRGYLPPRHSRSALELIYAHNRSKQENINRNLNVAVR